MRKLIMFYITITLSLAPLTSFATAKKTQRTMSSLKSPHNLSAKKHTRYKLVRYKANSTASHPNINLRLRHQNTRLVYSQAHDGSEPLKLASSKALVMNQATGEVIYGKNTNQLTPIASVTKLMTAMVILDAHLPMDDLLLITDEDVDYLRSTHSRLPLGTSLTRQELLQLALMSSENRAASALARNYPGGLSAFIAAMNRKTELLGMKYTHFYDSTGLDSSNVSTAEDLAKMVNFAYHYPEIRQVTTTPSQEVTLYGSQHPIQFVNTNSLVRGSNWVIGLSKTGFINEAGHCLVMQAEISGQPMIIVLLGSDGKESRIGDANRIRKWLEYNNTGVLGKNVSG